MTKQVTLFHSSRLSGFNELAGRPPLHQIAKDSILKISSKRITITVMIMTIIIIMILMMFMMIITTIMMKTMTTTTMTSKMTFSES